MRASGWLGFSTDTQGHLRDHIVEFHGLIRSVVQTC